MPTLQNYTSVIVVFHTWDRGAVVFPAGNLARGSGPLTRLTYTKATGGAPGVCQMAFKPFFEDGTRSGEPIVSVVQPGDWFEVLVQKNGTLTQLVVGKIDTVTEQHTTDNSGAAAGLVSVVGRDFSFAMTDTPLYFNPFDESWDNLGGVNMFQIVGEGLSGNPNKFVKSLMSGVFSKNKAFAGHVRVPPTVSSELIVPELLKAAGLSALQLANGAPGGDLTILQSVGGLQSTTKWIDYLDFESVFQNRLRGVVVAPQVLSANSAGSVLDFVKAWMNPMLNEFWLDTTASPNNRRGYVFYREKPFENTVEREAGPWFALPKHLVDARFLVNVNLTRGAHRVNHVWVVGEMLSSISEDTYGLYTPLYNAKSIERYGLRRLEETSSYLTESLGFAGGTDPVQEARTWVTLVRDWNALNYRYYNGNITIGEMRPEIRPGQKLAVYNGPIANNSAFPADKGEGDQGNHLTFYVDAVQHSITGGANPVAQTTVQVSRGFREGFRILALDRELREWTGFTGLFATSANKRTRLDVIKDLRAADTRSQPSED